MISASHNPMPDNGIKFLAHGGVKLDDAARARDRGRARHRLGPPDRWPPSVGSPRTTAPSRSTSRYLVGTIGHRLDGLKVVLDCANGAASEVGPQALRDAGAEVIAIGAEPDGLNINEGCGSTHLEVLQKAVLEHGADVGFALDGDADRCLAVDATGTSSTATRSWRSWRWR